MNEVPGLILCSMIVNGHEVIKITPGTNNNLIIIN